MGDVASIITAVEAALSTIPGLEGKPFPDTVVTPCAWVDPASLEIELSQTFEGDVTIRFDVAVAAAALSTGLALAVRKAWPYMNDRGTHSVTAAIEADPSLGGNCDSVAASLVNRVGTFMSGGIDYLGFRVTVEVFASIEEG